MTLGHHQTQLSLETTKSDVTHHDNQNVALEQCLREIEFVRNASNNRLHTLTMELQKTHDEYEATGHKVGCK
jgi:hypothetical protein